MQAITNIVQVFVYGELNFMLVCFIFQGELQQV